VFFQGVLRDRFGLSIFFQLNFSRPSRPGVANQSEAKSHISFCVTAESHCILWAHMNISPSLPHASTFAQ